MAVDFTGRRQYTVIRTQNFQPIVESVFGRLGDIRAIYGGDNLIAILEGAPDIVQLGQGVGFSASATFRFATASATCECDGTQQVEAAGA